MTGWDTRAQAGLRAPRGISTNINPTAGVAMHYGGHGPFRRANHSACRVIWRSWQDWHMSPANANNYADIAYNLGVCHHDIVLEGRSTRTRPRIRGGANGNATVNGNRYSVVAIWGASDGAWPDGLKRAWRFARSWLRAQDSRTGAGLTPHSAMSTTSCPGNPGRAWLAAGIPAPGGTPPPPPKDDDMPYRDWPQADKDAMLNDVARATWNRRNPQTDIAYGVMDSRMYRRYYQAQPRLGEPQTEWHGIRYIRELDRVLRLVVGHLEATKLEVAATQELVGELVARDPSNPLTAEDLDAAVQRGMQRHRVELEVKLLELEAAPEVDEPDDPDEES